MSSPKILNSWKEIANYMGRGVRTVQRYEMELHLPVRRLSGHPRTSVMAFPDEVDEWLHRSETRSKDTGLIQKLLPGTIKARKNGKWKIMLIEDEVEYVDKLRSVLSPLGACDVEVFSDPDESIYALRDVTEGKAEAPNVIVLDYELADSSGLEVLRYYRSNAELKAAVPLIVWTVLDTRTTKDLSLWMGARSFIPKHSGSGPLTAALKSVRAQTA